MRSHGLIAMVVLSCAPVDRELPRCPAVPGEPALPAVDDALRRWQAIVADGMRIPAGTTVAALEPELEVYLGSPDPVRRDLIAYEVLDQWIEKGVLGDAASRSLAARLIQNLRVPIPIEQPDGVFRRSFSALVLASIVGRDVAKPFLGNDDGRAILVAARDYAQRETDLRGHTGARGWAHAAAHTADLLTQLANRPGFNDEDGELLLDAVAGLVLRRHGAMLASGEDFRLAAAVAAAAKRGIAPARLARWLAAMKAQMLEQATPTFDPKLFAAQLNARHLLVALHVEVAGIREPTEGERRLLDGLRAVFADGR